jgi:hypothetical protein
MKELSKIEAVTERDIDLVLLEEMNVSESFCRWLAKMASIQVHSLESYDAWHSVCHATLGESDLVMIVRTSGKAHALLIENKIDAPAMPEQGARYRERGMLGNQDGNWDSSVTCMIAPQSYLDRSSDAKVYDLHISYEAIAKWLENNCDNQSRGEWKSYLIWEAVEQNRRGSVTVPDENATAFCHGYWQMVTERFPDLKVGANGVRSASSDWIHFYPDWLPKGCMLIHQLKRGFVDLQIAGTAKRVDQLRHRASDMDVKVVKAGKSVAFRVQVPGIDIFEPFERQAEQAMIGLHAAFRMQAIAHKLESEGW